MRHSKMWKRCMASALSTAMILGNLSGTASLVTYAEEAPVILEEDMEILAEEEAFSDAESAPAETPENNGGQNGAGEADGIMEEPGDAGMAIEPAALTIESITVEEAFEDLESDPIAKEAVEEIAPLAAESIMDAFDSAAELKDQQTVSITTGGEKKYFRFIPTESGHYSFWSEWTGEEGIDSVATLYDAEGNWITNNDDGGGNGNFRLDCVLEGGNTYYLEAGCFNDRTGRYTLFMQKITFYMDYDRKIINVLWSGDVSLRVIPYYEGTGEPTFTWRVKGEIVEADGTEYTLERVISGQDVSCVMTRGEQSYTAVFHISPYSNLKLCHDSYQTLEDTPVGKQVTLRAEVSTDISETQRDMGYIWLKWDSETHKYVELTEDDCESKTENGTVSEIVVTADCAAQYECIITDGCSYVYSYYKIEIDNDFEVGEEESFSKVPGTFLELQTTVNAADLTGITYQWYDDNYDQIEGATKPSYTVEVTKQEFYYCKVWDKYGNCREQWFYIHPDTGLKVEDRSSEEDVVSYGEQVCLSVRAGLSADVDQTLIFTWWSNAYKNSEMQIETNGYESTCTIASLTKYGDFSCKVEDAYGNSKWIYFSRAVDNDFEAGESESHTLMPGSFITLQASATARDAADMTYQWYDDNYDRIEGATKPSYTVEVTKSEYYHCYIQDKYGNLGIQWFYIRPDTGLYIVNRPVYDAEVTYGSEVLLSVEAAVYENIPNRKLTFTWDCEGIEDAKIENSADGTKSTCTIPALKKDVYIKCCVEDAYGREVWVDFERYVDTGFEIHYEKMTTEIRKQLGDDGTIEAELEMIATTALPDGLTYRWYAADDEDTTLGTESKLSVKTDQTTEYCCYVTDGVKHDEVQFGVYVDNLTVKRVSPRHAYVPMNGSTTLEVKGDTVKGGVTYQWQEYKDYFDEEEDEWYDDYVNIEGETSERLELNGVTGYGEYRCVISDEYNNRESLYFEVDILGALDLVYDDWYEVPVENDGLTLSVTALSAIPGVITYQWYESLDGDVYESLDGENRSSLVIPKVEHSGYYECEVINEIDGTQIVKSAWFEVYLDSGLRAGAVDSDEFYGKPGESVTLGVAAFSDLGENKITYQWYEWDGYDGGYKIIPGEIGTSYVAPGKTAEYVCKVSDTYNVRSVWFWVYVDDTFSVQTEKTDFMIQRGGNAEFQVKVTPNPEAVTYKWQKYDYDTDQWSNIAGAASAKLSVSGVTEYREYRCVISDAYNTKREYFSVGVLEGAVAPSFDQAVAMQPGETLWANIEEYGKAMFFKITPNVTGEYEFYSSCTTGDDTEAYLYDASRKLLKKDDDGGESWNFKLQYKLEGGAVYYLKAGYYNDEGKGSYPVTMRLVSAAECKHEAWTAGRIVKAATCTESGLQEYRCSACGKTENRTISALGHSAGAWQITKAAACGAAGEQVQKCTRCGLVLNRQSIAATGKHTYGAYSVTKAPTVLAAGVQTHKCSVCGHAEDAAVAKLAPTATLSAATIPLKEKQKTTKLTVTGLAAGDYVVSWVSDNTKAAKISGKANGTCTITAQKLAKKKKTDKATITITLASGKVLTAKVTVQKTAVKTTKVTVPDIPSKKLNLEAGKTAKLAPVIAPITSLEKVTFKSSNKKVATVSASGKITAKKSGKAKITVKSGKKSVTITVNVPKVKTTDITGVPAEKRLKLKKSFTLKPKLTPKKSEEKITFKSSNKKIVTVTSKGKVTAKKVGTAIITVKSGAVTRQCKVTVYK